MSLSSISFSNVSSLYCNSATSAVFSNAALTATAFTTNTRNDSNYGLITVTCSSTCSSIFAIYKMIDNNTSTTWQGLNSDYSNYFNEAGITTPLSNSGWTGGEYSDSNNSTYAQGSGYYYGFKVSGVQTRFTTNYLDDQGNSQTAYGAFINVFFNSTTKATLKSFTIGGYTSYNWDDLPREIIIVGSNDATNWTLIKDASDFGSLSPWSAYFGVTNFQGYKNATNINIAYNTYTYNVSTTSKYRYLRFIIKRLIRGRVLGMHTFNVTYDIYTGQ